MYALNIMMQKYEFTQTLFLHICIKYAKNMQLIYIYIYMYIIPMICI